MKPRSHAAGREANRHLHPFEENPMIPNTLPSITAIYSRELGSGDVVTRRPVAAWSDDGAALVPAPYGHLVPATNYAGFLRLVSDEMDL